jgi:hypothetical protein
MLAIDLINFSEDANIARSEIQQKLISRVEYKIVAQTDDFFILIDCINLINITSI